jgi:hypothetical protein
MRNLLASPWQLFRLGLMIGAFAAMSVLAYVGFPSRPFSWSDDNNPYIATTSPGMAGYKCRADSEHGTICTMRARR